MDSHSRLQSLIGHWGVMVTLYGVNLIYAFTPASTSDEIYLGNTSDRMGSLSSVSTCEWSNLKRPGMVSLSIHTMMVSEVSD